MTIYCTHIYNNYFVRLTTGDEILMKDDKGNIVLFNVKNLNTIVLANATKKVRIFKYCVTYYLS